MRTLARLAVVALLLPACASRRAPAAAPLNCPMGVGAAAQDPNQAARCLYQAWEVGDRSMAGVFASLDAVAVLFAQPWSPPSAAFHGCAAAIDDVDVWVCRFVAQRAVVFTVRRSEGGWRVTAVQLEVHDP